MNWTQYCLEFFTYNQVHGSWKEFQNGSSSFQELHIYHRPFLNVCCHPHDSPLTFSVHLRFFEWDVSPWSWAFEHLDFIWWHSVGRLRRLSFAGGSVTGGELRSVTLNIAAYSLLRACDSRHELSTSSSCSPSMFSYPNVTINPNKFLWPWCLSQ